MKRLRPEQIISLVLLFGLGGVAWWAFSGTDQTARLNDEPSALISNSTPDAIAAAGALTKPKPWPKPKAQSRGRGWGFELFTPPEIEYHAATGDYRVKPSDGDLPAVAVAGAEDAAAPQLLGVRQEDYPLQLTGFVGAGAQALGVFENRQSGETLLLRAGDRVAALGLEVLDFNVVYAPVEIPESMTVRENRAVATVRDGRGVSRTLREGVTALGPAWLARLAIGPDERELPEGAMVTQGPITYRIDKIRLAPASVDVTKENASDGSMEKLVLNVTSSPDSNQP
ncbi:MAG: hypothetical protein H7A44_12960 [Opitutaceae bacterium]|nr:hypothetical protein [Cephaloticoccus sp.]MCP5531335.1 hypothetical protein [Opitutaceae bacterium]